MNGLYCETCVKRKATIGTYAAKFGIIAGVILFVLLAIMLGGQGILGYIFMMLAAAAVVALFYVIKLFNVDYEYIFCDGQIDFDAISGGEKRKTKLRVDLDNIEVMAPIGANELASVDRQGMKTYDFSSRDPQSKKYALIVRDSKSQQTVKIIFEPSETMIAMSKQKKPRKVF